MLKIEPCAGRAAVIFLAPPQIFDDRRAADATMVCLITLLHFHPLNDFDINSCLGAK